MTDLFWTGTGLAPRSMADELTEMIDVTDEGEHFVLRADLPSVHESDLEIDCQQGTVAIRAKRSVTVDEGWMARRRERGSFTLDQTWRLPAPIDPERATATLRNGALELVLPKIPAARPRRIPVRSPETSN